MIEMLKLCLTLQEKEKVAALRKTFEEEKAQIEDSMNQQDPKEAEMAEELKKIQEEIEGRKVRFRLCP